MKIEHYVVVFFIVTVVMFLMVQHHTATLEVLDNRTEEYDRNIDQATDDAMRDMIAVSDSFTSSFNLEDCRDSFFQSLYSSFGVSDSQTGRSKLQMYVPILLVTAEDGFYIMHHNMNTSGSLSKMQWTEKMPYFYQGSFNDPENPSKRYKYVINYRMTDEITLAITYDGRTSYYDGKYKYLTELYPGDDMLNGFMQLASATGELLNSENFDTIRLSAMTYQITKKVNYYVNQHNSIAQSYGISYQFSLPESSTDSFARVVGDITLMAIFQGYPYGVGTDDVYSRFSISGSRLFKSGRYVMEKGNDGILYYHRSGCSLPESVSLATNYFL